MWFEDIQWNANGLVPVIAQQVNSNDILMMAWMNREALVETVRTGRAVYWSRSRKALWRKGETSGHIQYVHEIRLDCDADAILIKVDQIKNIACHTGRHSCFFRQLKPYQLNLVATTHQSSLTNKNICLENNDYCWHITDPII